MNIEDEEKFLHAALSGDVDVQRLDESRFLGLLGLLERMFVARVMNCVDASGKKDKEWLALSAVFGRLLRPPTAGRFFVEYGALQEHTADGPKRVIECDTSASPAVKITEGFAWKIARALNGASVER